MHENVLIRQRERKRVKKTLQRNKGSFYLNILCLLEKGSLSKSITAGKCLLISNV